MYKLAKELIYSDSQFQLIELTTLKITSEQDYQQLNEPKTIKNDTKAQKFMKPRKTPHRPGPKSLLSKAKNS